MKVLDHALRMEQNAKAYYQRLARETECRELKSIFTLLAEAEDAHYRTLLQRGPATVESNVLQESQSIFEKLLGMKDLHDTFEFDADGYLHAVRAEEESIRYYQEAAEQEQNEEAKELLLALVAEEKQHLSIIENIYEFVEAPRSYLEVLEFTNREPL